ncbi:cytochrome b5-related protein [Culex quinquefasciatus]|uniref:cytochrome b5-related protein n=1 Tax=Culex quinquefasciatus TaxID=7176 RepID=UPI0018E3E2A4|nr:cytochrome b5-related protein [Culex quinquefasciatus]
MVNFASSTTTTVEAQKQSTPPKLTSSITRKDPTNRLEGSQNIYRWLDGKRADDGAEGLWRIHDTLYDLSDFIGKHPGGKSWLKVTKGTDITEAFETHHIGGKAERMLPLFKVRSASQPRHVRLTFHKDGFYRTLKRKVAVKLKDLDFSPVRRSEQIMDALLVATFGLAFLANIMGSYVVAAVCALFVCWTMICAHNFFHKKDNWRMLFYNLALLSYREMRVAHAMSHHLYPNSILDLEISFYEPWLSWMPLSSKNLLQRYASWGYGLVVYFVSFANEFLKRIWISLTTDQRTFYLDDMINLTIPFFMYVTGTRCLWEVLLMWVFIELFASFCYAVVGISAAHQHPEAVHYGDLILEDVDFGIYQVSAIVDRSDTKGSQFKVLTSFGDHCLHHMFPTLDHGLLPQLYPTFLETCAEFEVEYRERPWWHMFFAQYKQLARVDPITYLPGRKTK